MATQKSPTRKKSPSKSLNVPINDLLVYFLGGDQQKTINQFMIAYPKLFELFTIPRKLYKDQFLKLSPSERQLYVEFISKQLNNDELYNALLDKLEDVEDVEINKKGTKNHLLNEVALALQDLHDNKSVENAINILFKNCELIGDFILGEVINSIINDLKKSTKYKQKKYKLCISLLDQTMNSNIFLKELLDKINFDIQSYVPKVLKLPIRTAKRENIVPEEILGPDCIDFKYTSNYYEQLIFLSFFLLKGFEKVKQSFLNQITAIGFDPKSYVDYCFENKVYPYIKFKSGCSCRNRKTNERLCDNPRQMEPNKSFLESLPCPEECGPVKKQSEKKSKSKSQKSESIPSLKRKLSRPESSKEAKILKKLSGYSYPSNENIFDFFERLKREQL